MRRLWMIIGILLTLTPVMAVTVNTTCINDTHLREYYTYNMTVGDDVTTTEYLQLIECSYNCSEGACKNTNVEMDANAAFLVFIMGFVFVVISMAKGNISDDLINLNFSIDMVIRVLGFFLGFYFMNLSMAMTRGITNNYGGSDAAIGGIESVTVMMSLSMWLMLFVYLLMFFANLIRNINVNKERKKWKNDDG